MQIPTFAKVQRKEIQSAIGLCLKNSCDWNGRRGRRVRGELNPVDPLAMDESASGNEEDVGIIQQSINIVMESL